MNSTDFIQNLSQDLKPVKPLKAFKRRLFELLLICISFVVLAVFYWNMRTGESVHPEGRTLIEIFLLGFTAVSCSYWATKSVSPHHSGPRVSKWSPLAFIGWAVVLIAAFLSLYSENPAASLEALQYNTWLCPIVMATIGLPVAVLSFGYLSRGAIHFPVATFFYWSVLSVSFGALGLAFVCPWTDPLHELLWHVLPAVLTFPLVVYIATALFRFWQNQSFKNLKR